MPTEAERTLCEDIDALPDEVRDFYVDLDNIRLVHPLVVAVQRTNRTETSDGAVLTYRVRDRIRLGPLVLPIGYTATLRVPRSGDVQTEACQFPAVRIRGRVSFDAVDGATRLIEHLRIAAPWPLAGFTVRQATDAHITMLAGIKRHFEA